MFADYIFPDLSIWERWGAPRTSPDVVVKASMIRQPIVAPMPETARVFGEALPISMEALMLGIAERLSLPGYGRNGFEEGMDFTRSKSLAEGLSLSHGFPIERTVLPIKKDIVQTGKKLVGAEGGFVNLITEHLPFFGVF